MQPTPLLSDVVWRQLDPHAGRLSPRTARRVQWAIAVALVAVVVGELCWYAGLIAPRLSWTDTLGSEYGWDPVHHSVSVHNDGLLPVRVLDVGRSGRGFTLQGVTGDLPATVDPGGDLKVVLTYQVTDCAAVPAGAWPVPIRVERPWGVQTVYIGLPTKQDDEAPDGLVTEEVRQRHAVEWQQWLADVACRYPT